MDSDQTVAALAGHGLQIAADTAVGLCELGLAEAPRDFLPHLAHAQVAFGTVVRESNMRVPGEEQHGGLVLLQSFREIMGIGFRYSASLPTLPYRDGWEFPLGAGEDITVADLADFLGSIPPAERIRSVAPRVSDRHMLRRVNQDKSRATIRVRELFRRGGSRA